MNAIDSRMVPGLTANESKVLLYLGEQGPQRATAIAKGTGVQRPNVYDILKILEQKGLIVKVIENNIILYKPVSVQQFKEMMSTTLKAYELSINELVSKMQFLQSQRKLDEDVDVQIFTGFKGARMVLFDSIEETKKTGKELLGVGVRNKRFFKEDVIYYKRYVKAREQLKMKSRYIIHREEKLFVHKYTSVRFLDAVDPNPTALYIYGNKISMWLWFKIPIIICIDNAEIANAYRAYFEFLWKTAKKN